MGQGRVAAVFDRSFYIEWGDAFACIGVPGLVPGPLTALTDVPNGMNWRSSGLRAGAYATGADGILTVDNRFRFDARSVRHWSAPKFPESAPHSIPIDTVMSGARAMVPTEGLAPLVFPDEQPGAASSVVSAALPAHRRMSDWLRRVVVTTDASLPEEAVCRLLGLGPGLTPSGDDYLGGMMIALPAFGYGQAAERLYAVIEREAPRRTNRISAAYLAAAREGWGAAPLHDVLNRLVAETEAPPASLLRAVDSIGHTSGWDALAGILAVVRAMPRVARGGSRAA